MPWFCIAPYVVWTFFGADSLFPDPMAFNLKGLPVSPGIVRGTAYVLACDPHLASPAKRNIQETEITAELQRFHEALRDAEHELLDLQKEVRDRLGDSSAEIFNAQVLALRDQVFIKQVCALVELQRINIESALTEVIEGFSRTLAEAGAVYLRERAADIRDIGRRILSILIKHQRAESQPIPEGAIVVAEELFPSATANMEVQRIRGMVCERGGRTSHASILARSLGTPAITGVVDASKRIKTGDFLILDGMAGNLFVNPDADILHEYDRLEADLKAYRDTLKSLVDQPARTADGVDIQLFANIGKMADAEAAALFKADGVGLYRTEFAFAIQSEFPTEEEQFRIASTVAERFHPKPVVFRTLDLGGDKQLSYFPLPPSRNPALSERGIRLMLKHREVMATQLRAILRVSASHPVRILLPMVAGVEEARAARKLVEEVKADLLSRHEPFNPNTPLGGMIEVPSAAIMASALARELDFFSIGTNDLIQYLLVADREDPAMVPYYEELHPAVLRTIKSVVEAIHAAGKEVSVCGEMAGDSAFTEVLLGLGVRSFSVAPGELLEVKDSIRLLRVSDAITLAEMLLHMDSVETIHNFLRTRKREPSIRNTLEPASLSA